MNELSNLERALELLQQLGLKEYESQAFVALSRPSRVGRPNRSARSRTSPHSRLRRGPGARNERTRRGTTHEPTAVPRGLDRLVDRDPAERVRLARRIPPGALRGIEPLADDNGPEATHEVWSLSGESAIQSRTQGLIEEADRELILVIGHAPVFTDGLRDRLKAACRRGVTLIVGVVSEALQTRVEEELPEAEVSVSGLDWLQGTSLTDDDTEISRLLLIDRNTILISTFHGTTDGGKQHEQAVFGRGFDNGLVTIIMTARRKPATSGAGGSRQHGHKPRSMAGRLPTPIQTNINTEHCI